MKTSTLSSMSLDELFHYEDSQITRRWFESTNLLPSEAIAAAERIEKLEHDLSWSESQAKQLELEIDHKDSQLSLINTCLDNLRCRLFGDDTFRESTQFGVDYDFYEETSHAVLELRGRYCPDLNPTAMMVRVEEGEMAEVWATESNNYFSKKTVYMRVF